ncbi:MAG: 50S ribosomal protein L25 [Tumebacillaceae bacterium]
MATNRITLEAHPRTSMSKGEKKQIRNRGDLPGIVYGKNREPKAIYITGDSFKQLKNHGRVLVDVMIGGERVAAMVNDIDKCIMTRKPKHIDLHAVDLREPINVDVAIFLDGLEPVEKRGAVIQQQLREVSVRCLPTDVPEYIMHNISNLQIGETVRVGELVLPSGVELNQDADEMICSIIEAKNAEPDTSIEPKEPELVHDQEGKGENQKNTSDDERYSTQA